MGPTGDRVGGGNIILTGFMGTGKTTVGRMLAERMGRPFLDTDEVIENRSGLSVQQIFQQRGEAVFRRLERDLAMELANREGLVIATGGSFMLAEENARRLCRTGRVFCLTASPQEVLARIQADGSHPRPLLEVADPYERIASLMRGRSEGYRKFARIDTDGKSPGDLVELLSTLVGEEG